MVVDDVEDHLDAGGMQPPHGDAHLMIGLLGEITRLNREEAERVVAPVVAQALLDQRPVLHEGMNRKQFDGRNAKPAQMIDDPLVAEGRERAALVRLDVLAQHREAAHMGLVDHRVCPRNVRRPVVGPVEALVGDDALHHAGRAVAAVEREIGAWRVYPMTEQRIGPSELAGNPPRIGVEQQLVGIEAVSALRLIGAMGAIAVQQTDLRIRQVAVPHLIGEFRQCIGCDLPLALRIEQTKVDALSVRGEHREVRA